MNLALGLLGGLGAVLLLGLFMLLVLPVRVMARADESGLLLRVSLLAGLVPLTLVDSSRPPSPRKAKTKAATGDGKGWRPSRKMLSAGFRAALEALRTLRIERLRAEVRLGLGDPALTGEFYGRAMGAVAALSLGDRLRLVPLFDRQALEGQGEAIVSLVPARLLPVAVRFLWALR
ncbi:hypothetical protein [Pararhodobacter sp. CCB-MM2]|uniref:hypothetical protein n=1 Tax=Pararhodobacter sp. CCB-MM2 TaxID=1786003 RepID=UPI0008337A09|nr:hypothetical protein [Pararhodobacter sp. CCB-MM2]